jgi:hypothetical protein
MARLKPRPFKATALSSLRSCATSKQWLSAACEAAPLQNNGSQQLAKLRHFKQRLFSSCEVAPLQTTALQQL